MGLPPHSIWVVRLHRGVRSSHVTGLQPPVAWVGSDGVQAIGTTRDLGEGRPLSLHSMLRGVARGWPLLAKYGCAPPWKALCLQARAIRRPAARAAAQQSVAAAQGERLQASRAAQLTSTVQACFQKQRGSRIVY